MGLLIINEGYMNFNEDKTTAEFMNELAFEGGVQGGTGIIDSDNDGYADVIPNENSAASPEEIDHYKQVFADERAKALDRMRQTAEQIAGEINTEIKTSDDGVKYLLTTFTAEDGRSMGAECMIDTENNTCKSFLLTVGMEDQESYDSRAFAMRYSVQNTALGAQLFAAGNSFLNQKPTP